MRPDRFGSTRGHVTGVSLRCTITLFLEQPKAISEDECRGKGGAGLHCLVITPPPTPHITEPLWSKCGTYPITE